MKKIRVIIVLVLLIAALVVSGLYFGTIFQKNAIVKLEEKIGLLKEEMVPLRFKILEKNEEGIKVAIKFYDADGNVVQRYEGKIPGEELSLDFYVIPIGEKHIAFPYKIFSNKIAAKDGIELFPYYNADGFPQIFYSQKMDSDLKAGLTDLFTKVQNKDFDTINGAFGSMVQDIKPLNAFKDRTIYKIVVHTKGGIEIIEE